MLHGLLHLGLHLVGETLGFHERGHHADAHALDPLGEVRREVDVQVLARAVQHVAAGERSHGFLVEPNALVSVEEPNANSSMLSLPSGIPPASMVR